MVLPHVFCACVIRKDFEASRMIESDVGVGVLLFPFRLKSRLFRARMAQIAAQPRLGTKEEEIVSFKSCALGGCCVQEGIPF